MNIFLFPTEGLAFGISVKDIPFWGGKKQHASPHVTIDDTGFVKTPEDIGGLCTILNTMGLISMGRKEPIRSVRQITPFQQTSRKQLLKLLELKHLQDVDLSSVTTETLQLVLTIRARLIRLNKGKYPTWAFHINEIVDILKKSS